MKQHVATDQVAVRYADGVDHVWSTWEPALRRCERVLGGQAWRAGVDGDELAHQLRRAQYRAHTAAEFASGLVPPPSAIDAHTMLVATLGACRDALGVIALRAELDELDEDIAEIGLHAVDTTRDAFRGARTTTALVHAWIADDQVDPEWLHPASPPASRTWQFLLWMLAATCAALFIVLTVQLFVFGGVA
jgi:hypothetical protein